MDKPNCEADGCQRESLEGFSLCSSHICPGDNCPNRCDSGNETELCVSCQENANEAAYDRSLSDFYGGDSESEEVRVARVCREAGR